MNQLMRVTQGSLMIIGALAASLPAFGQHNTLGPGSQGRLVAEGARRFYVTQEGHIRLKIGRAHV